MSDDLTSRRNARTMRGVIACGPNGIGKPGPEDLDVIDRFQGFLREMGALPESDRPSRRRGIYKKYFPEDATPEPGEPTTDTVQSSP